MIVTLCIMLYRCRSSVHLSLVVEIIRLYWAVPSEKGP
jgi:hypothetical protein